jgi:hypothetical protein
MGVFQTGEKQREYNQRYHARRYASDPEYRERKRRLASERASHPLFNRKRRDARVARCAEMFEAQGGRCALCDISFQEVRRYVIDHCHNTGEVRALLCDGCNTALGKFKDSPELLRKAAHYIERFR